MKKIEKVLEAASVELMQINGVQGVGQGKTDDNKDCLIVFTNVDPETMTNKPPQTYHNYDVVVRYIGKIDAF